MPYSKTALILMVAFALPGAAEALGLGDIHVDSALNEPLAAEVDIVGATAEDLAGITASVADSETFLRFGVDRPAFLSTTSFRIAMGRSGQPVLAIRSTDAFTEPLINVLIDLHWRSGELIRQYTLLLDPPGFPSDTRVADAVPTGSGSGSYTAPASPEPVSETLQPASPATSRPEHSSPAVDEPVPPEAVKVAAGATLRGIASRLSSRGNAGLERMMIAIFRANPKAFEGNINRLRRGAVLAIPSSPEVSKISSADANHEIQLQMDAWRASAKFVGSSKPDASAVAAPAPAPDNSEIPTEPVAARQASASKTAPYGGIHASGSTAEPSDDASLDRRVLLLEKGLNELQGTLGREQQTLAGIQASAALADKAPAVTAVPPPSKPGHAIGATLAAVLVLASAAFGVSYAWRRHRMLYYPAVSPADAKTKDSGAFRAAVHATASRKPTPAVPLRNEPPSDARIEAISKNEVRRLDASAERTIPEAATLATLDTADTADTAERAHLASAAMETRAPDANAETTPLKAVRVIGMPEVSAQEHSAPANAPDTDKSDADTAKLQYKLLDLDGTVHHVPMPSILYEKGQFKERRTSLVDVLKVAVKREPNRRDLRMKLLETYYAAAATSRQGFLEIAQSLAGERASMADAEWGKIAGMGRLIAADHDLFTPLTGQTDNSDLATCA